MPEQKIANGGEEEDVKIMKEWLVKQPHLPSIIDDLFLRRFLHCCNHSLEKSKNLLDLCYTVRSQAPEIFSNRDPTSSIIQNIFNITDMIPLPKPTKDNYKLFIYRLADFDADKYTFVDSVKTFFAVADVRMATDPTLQDGEVPIFDMTGFSLRHASKAAHALPVLKKYMVYTQEAHPVQLKQIHIINVPPFVDKVVALIKPFMKSEVAALLHFHLPNSTTLYEYVPQDLLPEEYGGNAGKIVDLKAEWVKKVIDHKDYLTNEARWKVDESKRSTNNSNGKQLFGIPGSFRALSID